MYLNVYILYYLTEFREIAIFKQLMNISLLKKGQIFNSYLFY